MSWRSRPPIRLSRRERKALKTLSRKYTARFCDVMRAKIVVAADRGDSTMEIARKWSLPRQFVLKWLIRFARDGMAGLNDQPRPGRPRREPSARVAKKSGAATR